MKEVLNRPKNKFRIYKLHNKNIIILILLFYIQISISLENNIISKLNKYIYDSEITITVKGKGKQTILTNVAKGLYDYTNNKRDYYFNITPSEILVNDKKMNETGFYVDNLTEEENNITIKFNQTITNCNIMFYNLKNITNINLSKFDSSKVNNMDYMFGGCSSLISKDLSNFKTSSSFTMYSMFKECKNLKSLDLCNFNTLNVKHMEFMFSNCSSLISLDLSNFNTQNVCSLKCIFDGCSSLISLDLSSFNTSNVVSMDYMFYGCGNLISLDLSSFNTSNVVSMNYMFYGCRNLISLDLRNFNSTSVSKDNNMDEIFNSCSNKLVYCIIGNNYNYNIKYKIGQYSFTNNCSDICFQPNKKIIFDDHHRCALKCNEINKYEYKNICYNLCPIGTLNISDNICIKDNKCIISKESYDIINDNKNNIEESNMIEKTGIKIIEFEDIFKNTSTLDGIHGIKELEDLKKNLIKQIEEGSLDSLLISIKENKNDYLIKYDNNFFQITSLENHNNNKYDNISSMHIDKKCEDNLKIKYNIDQNESLILLKSDYFVQGINIPLIRYEIFHPITKEILDLQYCDDTTIKMNIPVDIDEEDLEKHNPNSSFYTDICHSYNNENGVDLTLYDRKKEYNEYNYSLCPNKCTYSEYDNSTKKVSCDCEAQSKSSSDISLVDLLTAGKLLNNFIDIKSISNFGIIKCYKETISKYLIKNIGSYILMAILLFFIIFCILFYIKGYGEIIKNIEEIIKSKKRNENENIEVKKKFENNGQNFNVGKIRTIKNRSKTNRINIITSNLSSSDIIELQKININKSSSFEKNNQNIFNDNNEIHLNEENIQFNKDNNCVDFEINSLTYKEAIKIDKRTFIQYYISLIKTKHLFVFSFFNRKDYNSNIIKKCLFFYSFALFYFVNALFFTDATMHKIYVDGGLFNFGNTTNNIFIYYFFGH